MFSPAQYQLLDFGEGRKLERFGRYLLDRPSPAAEGLPQHDPARWPRADACFVRAQEETGRWTPAGGLPDAWSIEHDVLRLQLRPTPYGHVGVFAEQAENWDWIRRQLAGAASPAKVLNLFGYTGGSSLAAASAAAQVVHVDAARNVVAWARRNAAQSGLAAAPIRWITEDATRFVEREVRRGNHYDAVILDPPSYGHGPRREVWKIDEHLPPLLRACRRLTRDQPAFLLLTCHSPSLDVARLRQLVVDEWFGAVPDNWTIKSLCLAAADGRELPSGVVARWPDGDAAR